MSALSWYAALAMVAAISTFSVVFRKVRDDLVAARDRGVPVAVATSPRRAPPAQLPWQKRASALTPSVQAALVAAAASSIFVMTACLMLCVVLALRGG